MANYRLRIGQTNSYPLLAEAGGFSLSGQSATLTYTPAVGGEPYSWYTALDKAVAPLTISEAAAPTGAMTDVTAANASELASHIYTPNRRITLTGNIGSSSFTAGNIQDVDIIVPPGILWGATGGAVTLGNTSSATLTRVRIRGNTVGSYSGGQIHAIQVYGAGSDVILDGLGLTGPVTQGAVSFGSLETPYIQRAAITNCRINCGGYGIVNTASDLTITGCSIYTGNDLAFPPTDDEAYAIRNYFMADGNIVVYGCELRSNPGRATFAHSRFRCHPDPGIASIWAGSNRFIDRVENHIMWVDAEAGGGTSTALNTYVTYNEIISDGTGSAGSASVPKLYGTDQINAYIQNNIFKSSDFTSDTSIFMAGTIVTSKTGNLYQSLPVSDPAWGAALANGITPGAGDPTGLDWTP